MHFVIIKAGIVEIAKDRFFGGMRHRLLVMRPVPQLCLRLVAPGAGLAADKRCNRGIACIPGRAAAVKEIKSEASCGDDQRRERRDDDHRPPCCPPRICMTLAAAGVVYSRRSGIRCWRTVPFLGILSRSSHNLPWSR